MFDISGYYEANSIAKALQKLSENENALLIAGGTDILIKSRERKKEYIGRYLVGITRIAQLQQIEKTADGDILIGAACSFSSVEKNPIIQECLPYLGAAVATVGGPQIRNMGTIGGNVCNGATSADSATMLFALDALLVIQNNSEQKEISIHEFYVGPGKVALKHDDLLIAIKIEKKNYENMKGHYIKFAQRNAMDIANLGCSVLLKAKDQKIEDLRIAFGVAGPTPLRAKEAEDFAKGKAINESVLEEIGKQCLKNTMARDSWRASKAFREHLIQTLPGRAIKEALNIKAKGGI